MAVKWKELAFTENVAGKTSEAWSKSIGSGGDYATWAAMIADMPDLIAHAVTVTIKAGTTLTETCNLKNKHGMTNEAKITIQAEKYFPTSGAIPTADSATATTLRDAALATAAKGDDYFNGCWVLIVHGTGTNNGFVPITDYVDATGDVVVASWPGTQPDATSRYLIVGALINGYSSDTQNCSLPVAWYGLGCNGSTSHGIQIQKCTDIRYCYVGVYGATNTGVYMHSNINSFFMFSGSVNNGNYGIYITATNYAALYRSGVSDNSVYGTFVIRSGFTRAYQCFGDANGTWGVYAEQSAQVDAIAPECSGSSGNHSDKGSAGTAGADQAAVY